MVEIKENVRGLVSVVDKVVKKLDVIETELTSNKVAHDRFEKRVSRSEAHLGLKSIQA